MLKFHQKKSIEFDRLLKKLEVFITVYNRFEFSSISLSLSPSLI